MQSTSRECRDGEALALKISTATDLHEPNGSDGHNDYNENIFKWSKSISLHFAWTEPELSLSLDLCTALRIPLRTSPVALFIYSLLF